MSILAHKAKALLELFCLQPIAFGWRQNSSSCAFASWGKMQHMLLHGRIRFGADWWFSNILRIRTGSDSILSDQDWTRTEKFHSPLISGISCLTSTEKVLIHTTHNRHSLLLYFKKQKNLETIIGQKFLLTPPYETIWSGLQRHFIIRP